jgi:hypothetical protein
LVVVVFIYLIYIYIYIYIVRKEGALDGYLSKDSEIY